MITCNRDGCNAPGQWPTSNFCSECWSKLPASLQREIIEARSQGQREEAEAIQTALGALRGP